MINHLNGEFLVNTTTASQQDLPEITVLDNGGFVVVWTDQSGATGDPILSGINAKIYDARGNVVKDEFRVNTETDDMQLFPHVTSIEGGGFAIVWMDESQTGGDDSGASVKGKIFDAAGNTVKDEFLVNTNTDDVQQVRDVGRMADGGFAVIWTDFSKTTGDSDSLSVKAKTFDASGNVTLDEFLVNTTENESQEANSVAALSNGNLALTWADSQGLGIDVKAKIVRPDGTENVAEFQVNTEPSGFHILSEVAPLEDGQFVVVWTQEWFDESRAFRTTVFAKVLDADGSTILEEFPVQQNQDNDTVRGHVAALEGGGFVMIWQVVESGNLNASDAGSQQAALASAEVVSLRGQVFDSSGARVGDEFEADAQPGGNQTRPVVEGMPGGGFVVTWQDSSGTLGDDSGFAIKARIFDNMGNPIPPGQDPNTPPVAVNDTAETTEETLVKIDVLANDRDDDGDTLSVVSVTGSNGPISLNSDGTISYTPPPGFTGQHQLQYTITDGEDQDTANVTITVTPKNRDPIAKDDMAVTDQEAPVTIDVLSNDMDPDGDTLMVMQAAADNGKADINKDGTVTYTPNVGFIGFDEIEYTISDGNGGSDSATVEVTVNGDGPEPVDPRNRAPLGYDDYEMTEMDTPVTVNVLKNDRDLEDDPFEIIRVRAENGTVELNPDQTVTFTPDKGFSGEGLVRYHIEDEHGAIGAAWLFVTVKPEPGTPNQPPIAEDDSFAGRSGWLLRGNLFEDNGNGRDRDPDGDPISLVSINGQDIQFGTPMDLPSGAQVTIQADGSFVFDQRDSHQSDDDTNVDASFMYTIRDSEGAESTAEVLIDLGDAPGAQEISILEALYRIAFDRPSDGPGFEFWQGIREQGLSIDEIANHFARSAEFNGVENTRPDTQKFLNEVYQNAFGRDPDQAGYEFWAGLLDAGTIDHGDVLEFFASSDEMQELYLADGFMFT